MTGTTVSHAPWLVTKSNVIADDDGNRCRHWRAWRLLIGQTCWWQSRDVVPVRQVGSVLLATWKSSGSSPSASTLKVAVGARPVWSHRSGPETIYGGDTMNFEEGATPGDRTVGCC